MTKHEQLMAEYDNLFIEERHMINDGLYADGCVWINKDMPTSKKLAVLAEDRALRDQLRQHSRSEQYQ